jgi:superoxide dismutase, Cu-Zn family
MNPSRLAIVLPTALLAFALSGCNVSSSATFTGSAKQYNFTPQGGSTASGTAKKVLLSDGSTASTLSVTGLLPSTLYVAHYHKKGLVSSSACASNGDITEGFGTFTTDATGNASVPWLSATDKISGSAGAYINVHLATSLTTVPLCADLEQTGMDTTGVTGVSSQKSFTAQGGSTASGIAKIVALSDGTNATTLVLAGLPANAAYAAHYHALGVVSSDPCKSAGPITLGFANFTSDASGNATVRLLGLSAKIAGDLGAYINVHLASDVNNVPLCANLKG